MLTGVLSRYPVLVSGAFTDDDPIAEIELPELAPPQIINLDEWFIFQTEAEPTVGPEPRINNQAREIEEVEAAFTLPAFYFMRSEPTQDVEEIQLALDFG